MFNFGSRTSSLIVLEALFAGSQSSRISSDVSAINTHLNIRDNENLETVSIPKLEYANKTVIERNKNLWTVELRGLHSGTRTHPRRREHLAEPQHVQLPHPRRAKIR